MGTLNINESRDRERPELPTEPSRNKNIDVVLLQEAHSSVDNEAEWGMSSRGQCFLSQASNPRVQVAVLFSQHLHLTNISMYEVEQSRFQVVEAPIRDILFLFINVHS